MDGAGTTITPPRHNRLAWLIVLLLFLGSVVNYIDRTALGVVMPQIRRDLSLSNTDYGLAVNAFLAAYMAFYVVGGRVADRLGCRRTFTLTITFWSVATMLHAFVQGLRGLCLSRGLLGMGEGGYYPTAIRGASEWFAPEERAKAVGLFLCGLSLGALVATPLVAWITIQYGWRTSFLAIGLLGFSLVPLWLLLHRRVRSVYGVPDPAPAQDLEEKSGLPHGPEASLSETLKHRKYWCVLAARALTDASWYFYLFWLPGYFQEVRYFSLQLVGATLWIPYLAADVGALGGAWASSALIRRGFGLDRGRKAVLIPSAMLAMVGGLTYFVSSPALAVGLVSLALMGHQSWSSNLHTVITEITPRRHVAVLYGITGAAGTMMGALTQPLIGSAVDLAGYAAPFGGAGLAYGLAACLLLAAGVIEPIRPARWHSVVTQAAEGKSISST